MYFLGIDVSTTATKALLMDSAGSVVTVSATEYPFDTPRPQWSEQHPDLWWDGAQKSIRAVIEKSGIEPSAISGIGLTGQMHGLVLVDKAGNILRPAILWNDQRTQAQCDEIHRRIGREKFIQITGNVALTGFTAPKILWVKENEPEIYAKAAHVLLPKDFVRYKLTDDFAMDKADGSGTILMDLKRRDWSEEVLSTLGIPRDWMPPLYEGPQITGRLTPVAAAATGLKAGIPVMAGGGDQAAQAVGVGAVEPGVVALTVGTSGVVFATTPSALIEPEGRLHSFCHAVPGAWHFMGVMLSAAGSLQWYRDSLAPGMRFDDLIQEAEMVPAGSEGLFFLPYLSGERTPHPDPLARGAFVGLTLRHGRGHMTRAVLEGVAFGLKDIFTLIQQAGLGEIWQVRASGGGIKNWLWRQILASVLETKLETVSVVEGGAYGAALLAGVGIGVWPDVTTACKQVIKVTEIITSDERQVEKYREKYPLYRELYPALKSSFQKMG
jgi:xylulokinase